MNSNKKEWTRVIAVIGMTAAFVLAFAITPLALASSPSASDQIEIIRANTAYKTARIDLASSLVSLAPASPSPDMKLIRQTDGLSGVARLSLLQAADDL